MNASCLSNFEFPYHCHSANTRYSFSRICHCCLILDTHFHTSVTVVSYSILIFTHLSLLSHTRYSFSCICHCCLILDIHFHASVTVVSCSILIFTYLSLLSHTRYSFSRICHCCQLLTLCVNNRCMNISMQRRQNDGGKGRPKYSDKKECSDSKINLPSVRKLWRATAMQYLPLLL